MFCKNILLTIINRLFSTQQAELKGPFPIVCAHFSFLEPRLQAGQCFVKTSCYQLSLGYSQSNKPSLKALESNILIFALCSRCTLW